MPFATLSRAEDITASRINLSQLSMYVVQWPVLCGIFVILNKTREKFDEWIVQ